MLFPSLSYVIIKTSAVPASDIIKVFVIVDSGI
jgi:hypothetical protein